METPLRRLLTFPCGEELLSASLDEGDRATGVLMVMGGSQTRIGSHRMYERLSKALSDKGYPSMRFDRRGVGDSSGEDPGYKDSALDLVAAASAFRAEMAGMDRIVGFGLCDGATALALHGVDAGISDAILVNPWLVEANSGAPPPAAIRSHYRRRLLSLAGWKKLLSGNVNVRNWPAASARQEAPRTPRSLRRRRVACSVSAAPPP